MAFSRETLIQLVDVLIRRAKTHAALETILIRFGIEEVAPASLGGLEKRGAALLKHLVGNPHAVGPSGASLAFEVAEYVLADAHAWFSRASFGSTSLETEYPELVNSLRQDGFEIQDGHLMSSLPAELGIAEAKDEVHELLERLSFERSAGHLNQAIAAHARGHWASANASLRTYFESMLDEVAVRLWPSETVVRTSSNARRDLLAQGTPSIPPFFLSELNEWTVGARGGFLKGLWERLHPQGSHPGLSDEEDSTFRLHLVLLTSRHLLRRFARR